MKEAYRDLFGQIFTCGVQNAVVRGLREYVSSKMEELREQFRMFSGGKEKEEVGN